MRHSAPVKSSEIELSSTPSHERATRAHDQPRLRAHQARPVAACNAVRKQLGSSRHPPDAKREADA